ncbi:crotonase [Sulfolobus acidocaldarius SUSAZ]|nr:crotonase [Sulfolobus acidocaldarius SUSAZ]
MSYETIKVERPERGIVKVLLHRPEVLNAINVKMRKELREVFENLAKDNEIRVIILTGHGNKAFSTGDDLKDSGVNLNDPYILRNYHNVADEMMRLFNLIDDYLKPVIAMVRGYCLGGGLELALSCDFIVADETSTFGFPEVNIGFIPGWGGTQRLPRKIGEQRAKYLIYTGDFIDATKAYQWGLIDFYVKSNELEEFTMQLARKISSKSPLVLRMAKFAIEKGAECSLNAGLYYEILSFMVSSKTEDIKEAHEAFLRKRKPEFKGK